MDDIDFPCCSKTKEPVRLALECGGDPDEGVCAWGTELVLVVDPSGAPCVDCCHIQANHHEHRHPNEDSAWVECAPGCHCQDWRPRDARAHGIAIDAIEDRVGGAGDPELSQWVAAAVDAMLATGWTPPSGDQTVYSDRPAVVVPLGNLRRNAYALRAIIDAWGHLSMDTDEDQALHARVVAMTERAVVGLSEAAWPGGFCEEHWSWLCSRGQGKCAELYRTTEATG